MIKHIDDVEQTITGYRYDNRNGNEEFVQLSKDKTTTGLHFIGFGTTAVYTEDIPKLIKALQLTYNEYKKVKE